MKRVTVVFGVIFVLIVMMVISYEDLIYGNTPIYIYQNNTVYVYSTVAPVYINRTVYVNNITGDNISPPQTSNNNGNNGNNNNNNNNNISDVEVQIPPPDTSTKDTTVTTPFIDHLVPTAEDEDISDKWADDNGVLRYITVMYKPTAVDPDLNALRRLIGSIHDFEHETAYTTVFGYGVPDDFYFEIRTFSFVRYIAIPEEHGSDASKALQYAMDTSRRLYYSFIYIELAQKTQILAGMADVVKKAEKSGKIGFTNKDGETVSEASGFIQGDGEGIMLEFDKYMKSQYDNDHHGRCTLFRNVSSPYRTKHVFSYNNENFNLKEARHNPDDKLICISIATFSGTKDVEVKDFSLMTNVMPSFLTSTAAVDNPNTRYRFAMYLGLQRDKFYDDPAKMELLKREIIAMTNDRSFSLRMFYTPLNAPALDITYKWNVLIDQGYRDGCDYIYQYSDDTVFVDPWVDKFVRYLEAESNFGIVGATDSNNPKIMTLAFSHRTHVSILGSFWPTHLKNWWSDTWAQNVYGRRYTKHFPDVQMLNTQKQGQRYPSCDAHDALYKKLKNEESRPAFIRWLQNQPQSYDIRMKLEYYRNGGEGEKKR